MDRRDEAATMPRGIDQSLAVAEADRCLLCHDPPCSAACPAGTDPGAFLRKLRLRNLTGAIRTIQQNNPLGGACGVLCPTARLCEAGCAATSIDRPIRIGAVQRFLVEQGWQRGLRLVAAGPPRPERVAIVGAGPAGLTCAAMLARQGFAVTVFEARAEPGGVIRYGVPDYRFDRPFLERELQTIRDLGVVFRCGTKVCNIAGIQDLANQGFAAIYLATGLWQAATLGLGAGVQQGLHGAVAFLERLRDGGAEALRDEIAGRNVVVVGGGSGALDCAESALRLGAQDVYLVYRRSYLQMPAERAERIAAQEAGVHFLLLTQPVGYRTDEAGGITGVELVRTRLGAPDASGRRRPEELPDTRWLLPATAVIEAIGNQPAPDSPGPIPGLERTRGGLVIAAPETGRTSVANLWAGGDLVGGPGLVVQAVRDGKRAAQAIAAQLGPRGE